MLNPSESLAEKFVRRGIWLYFFAFLTGPIGYVVKIILSHDLSVEEIGILYGVISLISLLSVYHDLGLTESMNYFLPRFIVEKNYSRFKSMVFYSLIAQLVTSALIGGALFFAAGPIALHYFHASPEMVSEVTRVIQIFCLFFLGMNLHGMNITIFSVSQNTRLQKWVEFFRMLSILLFTAGVWFLDSGSLLVYAWMWNVGIFTGIVFGSFFMYRNYYLPYLCDVPIVFERDLAKEIVRYALWVVLAANVGGVLSQIDMQLIIYLLDTEKAGYYTNYLTIIGIPFLLLGPMIGFLFPVVSELHGKSDRKKITLIKWLFYKYFSVLGIVTWVFMFVFGPEAAVILFGEKFRESGVILQYSSFFIIFNFLLQIDFQLLAGVGQIRKRVNALTIGLVVNVILNLILIRTLGVEWSALAVGLSWIPIWYVAHRLTSEYHSRFDYGFFLKNLGLCILLGGISYTVVLPYFHDMSRIERLFGVVIALFFYIIPLALANLREIRLFISELKSMRARKNVDISSDPIADNTAT